MEKEIFPVESPGKHYFIMPLTVLVDSDLNRRVACFEWYGDSQCWVFLFNRADDMFLHDKARFACPGK